MYYEIYIDQFFAEHLLTGFLLLELSAAFCKGDLCWKRMLTASTVNAAAVTVAVIVCTAGPWTNEICFGIVMAMGYLAGMSAAVIIAFSKGKEKIPGKTFGVLLIIAIVFAGLKEAVQRVTGISAAAASVLAAMMLGLLERIHEKKHLKMERTASVTVYWENKSQTLSGIIDTGNMLREPLTGKAVSIVEKASIIPLLESRECEALCIQGEEEKKDLKDPSYNTWQQRRGFYLIPYHSIGKDRGWLQAVTVDKMEIQAAGRSVCVRHPILAIYEGNLSAQKEYQIVLHPQHVN